MFRKLVLGFAASAALGLGLLVSAAPASAQSWSVTIGSGHRQHTPLGDVYQPVGQGWGQGGGYGSGYGYGGGHGRGWGRPHHPHWGGGPGFGGPRCFVRNVRFWDGWGWVVERRRICH